MESSLFYYAQMNQTFLFASEIKAFMEHPKFDKIFNEDALGNYLSFQFDRLTKPFSKEYFVFSPVITLFMKMGKWKYRGILNRILQENMKKHSMKLRLKWKKS